MPPDAIPPADGSPGCRAAAEAKSVDVNSTTSAVTSLEASLTDEVLLEVLYCISPLEILHRVCRVSKRMAAITTSRDAPDLRYWRYHPQLPRSLRERLRGEDADTKSGPRPLNLDRRQLQMLVCLCTPGTDSAVCTRGAQADEHLKLSPIEIQWSWARLRIRILASKPLPERPWELGMIPPVAEIRRISRCGDSCHSLADPTHSMENFQRGDAIQHFQQYFIGKGCLQAGHSGCRAVDVNAFGLGSSTTAWAAIGRWDCIGRHF